MIWYNLLTQLILILGSIRELLLKKLNPWSRGDRLCYIKYAEEYKKSTGLRKTAQIACCDCGAYHFFWEANKGIYGIPIRPKKYEYKFRLFSKKASLATKEEIKKADTGE